MLQTSRCVALLSLVFGCASCVRGEGVPSDIVHFQSAHQTSPGQSIFLLGDIDELGGGDITRSLKLAPSWDGRQVLWSTKVAIPQGSDFIYRFYLRSDGLADWSDPGNGEAVSDPAAGSTSEPQPALRSLAVFALVAEDPQEVIFHTADGPVARPFAPVPGRADLVYALLPDQPNGRGTRATLLGAEIETPLHTILRRFGPIYNYDPDPAGLPLSRVYEHALPTETVPATRTVDGVTGRGFQVYVPRGYAAETQRRYPVLYMHDGQNCFHQGGPFGSWHAEEVADDLIRRAQMREIIIVAVDNSQHRFAEYVPEWPDGVVSNDDYNAFLANELKPWIDANYRTRTEREQTGVIGSSLGGIASLVLGLEHGDTFGLVGAMSPSLWAGETFDRVAAGELPAGVKLYMDAGDTSDGGDAAVALRDELLRQDRALHGDLSFQIGYGHAHNEAAWHARLPDFLTFQFPVTAEDNALEAILACSGDIDGDGETGQSDLGLLLAAYEIDAGGDVDGDGDTDQSDLGILLADYGCANPTAP